MLRCGDVALQDVGSGPIVRTRLASGAIRKCGSERPLAVGQSLTSAPGAPPLPRENLPEGHGAGGLCRTPLLNGIFAAYIEFLSSTQSRFPRQVLEMHPARGHG